MALTPLPTPPSRNDPTNFSARADAFLEALVRLVDEFNSGSAGDSAFSLAQSLLGTGAGQGSAIVGHGASTVKAALDYVTGELANIGGNLNFATLPAATLPVADENLLILRQGTTNTKLAVSTVRSEFAVDAETAQTAAEAARAAAEAARDAALVNANVYATEAAGRAAVANGASFLVQGSGDVAAYLYRRTDASTSVLLAAYPAASLATRVSSLEGVQFSLSGNNTFFAGAAGNGTATGQQNAGFGKSALSALDTGNYLTAFGYRALFSAVSTQYSSAFGHGALTFATADSNTAMGYSALASTTTGSQNTAVGMQASQSNDTGQLNVAVGRGALYSDVTGSSLVAIGANALYSCTASGNTAVGESAAYSATTADNLTAIGRRAAYSKTTGSDCTFLGTFAGFSGNVTEINTGIGVTALGAYSFGHLTSGSYNTGVGRASGWYNTSGSNNTFSGYRCGYGNTTGSDNLQAGFYAGHNTASGNKNVMLGALADFYVPDSSSMAASASAGGAVTQGPHSYRVAFVLDGVETALSEPPVTGVAAGANQTITLTSIPTYTGPKTCSARKVYRTVADGEHLLLLAGTIGDNSTTTFADTTADGLLGAAPTHPSGSIMLGYKARAYKSGQAVLGSTDARITEVYIGGGVDDTSPQAVTHSASNASGTNVAGGTHRIAGGRSTGNAKGGSVVLSTAQPGSSGAAPNALVDWVTLDANGFLGIRETTSAAVPTPAVGVLNLFFEGGALKFRNSAGTVRTVTTT